MYSSILLTFKLTPPSPMTSDYMRQFRKNSMFGSIVSNSTVHTRFTEIVKTLQRDDDLNARLLGNVLEPNFEDSQLTLIQRLFTQLWQSPLSNGQIKLLQLVTITMDPVEDLINNTNYFHYLNVFYNHWEETLKVAMVHNRYEDAKGLHLLGIGDKLTWRDIETQARTYPKGTTASIKTRIEQSFAEDKKRYNRLITAEASAATEATSPTTGASSSSSSAEAEARAKAEAKARAEAEARAKAEVKARVEAELRAEAEAKAIAEAVLQPSAPPAPTSSTAISPVLTITPEISPSMVYKDNLLIDTKVTATYQRITGTRNPVHVIFIVDVSGSMHFAIQHVRDTLTRMVNTKLRAKDRVSIIKFNIEGSIVTDAATLPDDTLKGTIETAIVASGGTWIYTGFDCLKSLTKTDLETHIIFATDGQDFAFSPNFDPKIHATNGTVVTPERYVDKMLIPRVKRYLGESVPVHTIGMTTEVDQRVTGLLSSRTGTAQRFIRTVADIDKVLDELADYICAADRAPAGRVTVIQNGRDLQTLSIPSLPSGNSFPQLLRLPLSAVEVNQPVELRYEFPGMSPLIWQVNHDGSIVANIAPIAADILNRYEHMIATASTNLKAELLQLLVEIINLKVTYRDASWIELDNVEYKVRRYIDAIEKADVASQKAYNADTICLNSIVTPAAAGQSASSTATSQNTNGSPPSPSSASTQKSLITALNQDNVVEHMAYATAKGWTDVVIALQMFSGQAVSLENKLFSAISRCDIAAIRLCFAEGVSPNQLNSKGWSWVMIAIGLNADVTIIKILVELGVPLDVRSAASGVNALEMVNSRLSAAQVGTFPNKQIHVDRLVAIITYLQQQAVVSTPASPLIQSSLFSVAASSTSSPVASAMPKELQNMLCPVSMEIMEKPVILSTYISVDESTIIAHLAAREKQGLAPTCPFSGVALQPMLEGQYYIPNVTLKNTIEEWQRQQQPSSSIVP